jgi:hypothetical protein
MSGCFHVGEHLEGEQHGDHHHGGVAHPVMLLPPVPLLLHLLCGSTPSPRRRSRDEAILGEYARLCVAPDLREKKESFA